MADYSLGIAELGTAVNMDGLQAGLSQAEGQTRSGMQSAAEGGLSIFRDVFVVGLGNLISNAVTDLAGKIAGIGSSITQFLSSNQQFENYSNQFTVLLGSAEAAKQRMAELAQFGATTPFDLPGVVDADRILQGFGLHSKQAADDFGFSGVQIRTIAGDVASGTGVKFEEMAGYLGKFSAGATGEALARFAELGIVTRKQLGDMGLEFAKSGELMSPMPEAMNTLLTFMQQKYGGLMAVQSQSFEGMASNLGDFVGNAQRTLAAPIFDVFKDGLERLNQTTGAHSAEISAALTTIGSTIADALQPAIMFVANNAIPGAIAAFSAFEAGVSSGGIIGGIGGLISSLSGISPAFGYIGEGVSLAGEALNDAAGIFMDYADMAWDWGANIVEQFASGIAGAIGSVMSAVSSVASAVGDLMMPGSPPKMLPDIDRWGEETIGVWAGGMQAGGTAVTAAVIEVGKTASDALATTVQTGFETVSSYVTSASDQIYTKIADAGKTAADGAKEWVDTGTEYTKKAVEDTVTALADTGRVADDALNGKIEEAQQAAAARYETKIANIVDRISLLKKQLQEADEGSLAYDRIQTQIAAQERALTDARQDQADAVVAAKQKIIDATKKESDADDAAAKKYAQNSASLEQKYKMLQDELAKTEKGSKEYYAIQTQIDALDKKRADSQEKDINAQIKYKLATGDTTGALALYEEQLKKVEKGSAEYYNILTQINNLKEKTANAEEKAANDAAKQARAAEDAAISYLLKTGDTDAALKILRERQKGLYEDSAEYWKLKQQIEEIETKAANDAAKKAADERTAQLNYLTKTGDYAGALKILQDQLAGVTEGSAEWYKISSQIIDLQDKAAKDKETADKKAKDSADKALDAQIAHLIKTGDYAGALALVQGQLAGVTEGSAEWYKLQDKILDLQKKMEPAAAGGGGGGGGGMDKAAEDAKKAAAAQWAYNYATADTATKLGMLNQKLAEVRPGSEDYWKLKQQIAGVEKQHQGELDKLGDAQWQSAFRTADQATKIQMLREKLAGLSPDSVEYYKVLQQLNGEEERAEKAAEKSAKGHGAAGAAVKKRSEDTQAAIPIEERATQAAVMTAEKLSFLEGVVIKNRDAWAAANPAIASAVNSIAGIITGVLTSIAGALTQNAGLIRATLADSWQTAVFAVRTVLSGFITLVASILGVINAGIRQHGTTVLSSLIQTWATATQTVNQVIRALAVLISTVFTTIATFLRAHGASIVGSLVQSYLTVQAAIRTVLGGLGAIITSVIGFITSLLQTHGQTILRSLMGAWMSASVAVRGVVTALAGLIATVLTGIAGFITTHRAAIQGILVQVWTTIWGAVGGIVTALGRTIRTALEAVQTFLQTHGPMIGGLIMNAWAIIGSFVTTAVNAVRLVITTVLAFVQTFIQQHGQSVLSVLLGAWAAIQGAVGTVIGVLQAIITTVFGGVANFIRDNQTSIGNTINTVWNLIGGIIRTVTGIIQAIVGAWGSSISSDTTKSMNVVQTIIQAVWTAVSGIITGALQVIQGVLSVVLAAIQGNWDGVWAGILTVLQGIWSVIWGVISGVLQLIAALFGTSLTEIASVWTTNFQNIWTLATGWVTDIQTAFTTFWTTLQGIWDGGIGGVLRAVGTMLTNIGSSMRGFISDATGIGSDIIDGVAKGVQQAAGRIARAAANAVKSAISAAKAAVGIGSPSKEADDEVGQPIGWGVEGGVVRTTAQVAAATANLAKGAVSAAAESVKQATPALAEVGRLAGDAMTGGMQTGVTAGSTRVLTAGTDLTAKLGSAVDTGVETTVKKAVDTTMTITNARLETGTAVLVATAKTATEQVGVQIGAAGTAMEAGAARIQGAWQTSMRDMGAVAGQAMIGLHDQMSLGLDKIATLADRAGVIGASLADGLVKGFQINAAQIERAMAGIGAPMMRGMAIGITGNAKLVSDATGAAASQAFNMATSTVNDTMNFTANYRVMQSEVAVRDDLRLARMMRSPR